MSAPGLAAVEMQPRIALHCLGPAWSFAASEVEGTPRIEIFTDVRTKPTAEARQRARPPASLGVVKVSADFQDEYPGCDHHLYGGIRAPVLHW